VDKVIVRRMVLKRVIYGVDKNPMAVELAKVALWLHSFTVGAPLSFLDHHLRCGDSLFGETVRGVMDKLAKRGALLNNEAIQKARASSKGMEAIEQNTDADIAGVKDSASSFADVQAATAPLAAFMSLFHAFEWIDPPDKKDKQAINEWLDGNFGEPFDIATGSLALKGANTGRFATLLETARELVAGERYHNWQIAFPGVWTDWQSNEPDGGFDAVIGNPPWDRIKFQEVEWFAARKPEIAHADTAAKRKGLIDKLKKAADPLAAQYDTAAARAAAMLRMARDGGAFPLLSSGDVNIYSLFVERALALVKPKGLVGLLTPSGIASDKTASEFFRSISTTNRLAALFDFENKKVFFPDIHASFKFCAIVMGGKQRTFDYADCAFYLHKISQLAEADKCFALTGKDFALVNPNTGTAPIFRTKRDAELTTAIYARVPVLVDRSSGAAKSVWPVKYVRMFDMTLDSGLFKSKAQLDKLGAYPVGGNLWKKGDEDFVPLYEGKMVQAFDHRAASVDVDDSRLHRPGQPNNASLAQHLDTNWQPNSASFVNLSLDRWPDKRSYTLGVKHVSAPTNMRTVIAAMIPKSGAANSLPVFFMEAASEYYCYMLANLNCLVADFVARQKLHGQNLNLFVLEQLPVIPPADYIRTFGKKSAAEIVKAEVLALTYTAHDMEPFAHDMGYDGAPFAWDEMDRLKRRAKLDALYFILYGITNRDDVDYIYSTFPIVKDKEELVHKRYLSRDYCLMYMNALEAGDPDAKIAL
jgi:Eco57I restriction-modification methylase